MSVERDAAHLHHDIGRCYLELGAVDAALSHGHPPPSPLPTLFVANGQAGALMKTTPDDSHHG